MLTTYLNNSPYSKFVLIEDTLGQRGKDFVKYIVDSHLKNNCKVHYFVFEGNFDSVASVFSHRNISCYDFVSDTKGWLRGSNKQDFASTISQINKSSGIIVIDSLPHAIFQYNVVFLYKLIQQLLLNKDLLRIVTVLHQDLLENPNQTSQYFRHISTLALTLEPKFNSDSARVAYVYRKTSGKVVRQIEEYKFQNGILKSEAIKKLDPKVLVQESLKQVLPENLTTFKISLDERDKESRSTLVLPYLPKEDGGGDKADEGKIFYQFDHVDDWDEEDPDDDLDI